MLRTKEIVSLVVDVGKSMCVDAPRKRDVAVQCARMLLQQKLLFNPQDEASVLLLGTRESKNTMSEKGEVGYEHITDLTDGSYQLPSVNLLRLIGAEEPGSTASGDPLCALVLAIANLTNTRAYKKTTGRIVYISDLESPIAPESLELEGPIVQMLIECGISLHVICVGGSAELAVSNALVLGDDPVMEEDVAIDDVTERLQDPTSSSSSSSTSSSTAVATETVNFHSSTAVATPTGENLAFRSSNLSLFKRIVKNVRDHVRIAELLPAATTIAAMAGAHSRSVNQVTKFRGSLAIGSSIHIPCWAYSHTQEQRLPTFKKTSIAAACRVIDMQARLDQGLVSTKEFQDALKDPRSAGIVRDFSHKRVDITASSSSAAGLGGGGGGGGMYMDDQQDWTIPPEGLNKAYRYGKDIVPVSSADLQALMVLKTEKSLSVLAIIDAASVPRYAFMGTADVLVPSQTEGETKASTLAISAFARALSKEGKVALCRYVKRANGAPTLVIAIPGLSNDSDHPLFSTSSSSSSSTVTHTSAEENLSSDSMSFLNPSASVLVGDHRASVVPRSSTSREKSSSSKKRSREDDSDKEKGGSTSGSAPHIHLVSQQPLRTYEYSGPAYRPPPLVSSLPFDVLYLVPVPFDDDVRLYPFPRLFSTLDKYKPSETQLQVMDDYIDGMDLTVAEPGGYDPTQAFNPILRRYYQTLMARMLDPNAPVAELDKDVIASMRPIYERMPTYKPAKLGCAGLASGCFPLYVRPGSDILGTSRTLDPRLQIAIKRSNESEAVNPQSSRAGLGQTAQTAHSNGGDVSSSSSSSSSSTRQGPGDQRDVITSNVGSNPAMNADTKENANEVSGRPSSALLPSSSSSSSSSTAAPITAAAFRSVGTAHPVSDFLSLLSVRTEPAIVRAFATLADAIVLLATDSVRIESAVEALKSFRFQSFIYVEEAAYNQLLRKLKAEHYNSRLNRGDMFWLALEREGDALTLIHKDEAGGVSDVTQEMARNFISSENLFAPMLQSLLPPAVQEKDDDEEDLVIE